ncbi:MAG: hypothetical protein K9H84_00245 [Bacteroidales bacterium]|nr:hypothetical protein [Bacteroidales bacterium]
MEEETNTVLVAPLDWGLGHATRCIPLIRQLQEQNYDIVLAADGRAWEFLRKEFPNLMLIRLPGYKISYPARGSFILKILSIIPAFYRTILKENRILKRIIKEHNIKAVISDNRYGLWCKKVPSVFLGHQMIIKMPNMLSWLEWFIHKISMGFLKRFNECWIPDYQGKYNLSGDLAHKYPLPDHFHYIGPLSRFHIEREQNKTMDDNEPGNHILVILSGPEPQRTVLENKLLNQLENSNQEAIVVRGVTEKEGEYQLTPKIRVIHHAQSGMLNSLILESVLVVCRPGYSSIMDLAATGKKAVFIPTPGQTEQQYLARYFYKNKIFYYNTQRSFDLETAIEQSQEYEGLQMRYNPSLLRERIRNLAHLIDQKNNQ